jgi:hypothetical protein
LPNLSKSCQIPKSIEIRKSNSYLNPSWDPAQLTQSVVSAHLSPVGRRHLAWPIQPTRPWRTFWIMLSLLVCAFRPRRLLSLLSLTRGPRMLVSSSPLCRPSQAALPPLPATSSRPLPPAWSLEMPSQGFNCPAINPPLQHLHNPPRQSMALTLLMPVVMAPGTPPRCPPVSYER